MPANAAASLSWIDAQGNKQFVNAAVINISESGIRVESRAPLKAQTYVTIQSKELGLNGQASVRSCVKQKTNWAIGLEFSGGMKWKPKSAN